MLCWVYCSTWKENEENECINIVETDQMLLLAFSRNVKHHNVNHHGNIGDKWHMLHNYQQIYILLIVVIGEII